MLVVAVADVILWRRKEATISTLIGVVSAWLVFEVWGYTLLSLLSNILLLLISHFLFILTRLVTRLVLLDQLTRTAAPSLTYSR
jgi:hypothetical protein